MFDWVITQSGVKRHARQSRSQSKMSETSRTRCRFAGFDDSSPYASASEVGINEEGSDACRFRSRIEQIVFTLFGLVAAIKRAALTPSAAAS
ncbi:hypothetical protein OY671_012426 [Metschnikowia pulcherrima]|nr:hypothetical protein OY671_012426 [Metschnikowia pulcherrima]